MALTLIEKLKDPKITRTDPHEVAREMTQLYLDLDKKGLSRLFKEYVDSITPKVGIEATDVAEENFYLAAKLADLVKQCGYEASGQLIFLIDGGMEEPNCEIAQFYLDTIGYNPNK